MRMSIRRKNIIIVILMIILVGMTIGYSALSSYLTINGTSNITSDFKVVFTDIQEGTMNGATTVNKEIIAPTTATFQVQLEKPGSSAEYNLTVQNQGKLDAYLESIEGIDEANEKAPTDITFKISGITRYTKLAVDESKTFKVIVTFDESSTNIPSETKQLTLKLNFAQDSGNTPEPEPEPLGNGIEFLIKNKLESTVIDGGNGLVAVDNTGEITSSPSPREYRYIGINPNNYVQFNNELWRIIGIFDGRLKIIRKDSIGLLNFNNDYSSNWELSSLQRLLNSGDYYNRVGLYENSGLTSTSKQLIDNVTWNLGGVSYDYSEISVNLSYQSERGTSVFEGMPVKWAGKIALMYLSDYGFATSGGSENSRSMCVTANMYNWDTYKDCFANNWLLDSSNWQWTLTFVTEDGENVFGISNKGFVNSTGVYVTYGDSYSVRPTLYLKTDVVFLSGEGIENDPYVLK